MKLLEHTDEESGVPENELLPVLEEEKPPKSGGKMMIIWILVNTFATIGIVSRADLVRAYFKLKGPTSRSLSIKQSSMILNSVMHN